MSTFEKLIQKELPLRPFVVIDGTTESLAIRRGIGPRQVQFIDIANGQVLSKVNNVLTPVNLPTGSGSGSGSARSFVLDVSVGSPATTWTLNHNLNSFNCSSQVYQDIGNGSYEWVLPNSITLVNSNTVVIVFATAIAGKAILSFTD